MKIRTLHTKIWKDDYFASLNESEKLLFLYYLTNERVNLVGIYEMSDREVEFDTGIKKEQTQEIQKKFEKDKKFAFKDGWVVILNFNKHNSYNGVKLDKAIEKELKSIPDEIKEIEYQYSIDKVSSKHDTSNINININNSINNNNKLIKKDITFSEEVIKLTNYLYELIKSNVESKGLGFKVKAPDQKDFNEVRLLVEQNPKMKPEDIAFVMKWCQENDFWWKNIRSAGKFRKQFERLAIECKSELDKKVERQGIIL